MGFWSNLWAGISGSAAEDAAQAQVDAYNQAIAEQRRVGKEVEADFAPYKQTGTSALRKVANLLGLDYEGATGTPEERQQSALAAFQTSPGYQFRQQEGANVLERAAAARGKLFSGQTGKALTEYGQGVASQEYGDYYNRLAGVAGAGQEATQASANARLGVGSNISSSLALAGQARASGYVGAANAATGTASSIFNYLKPDPEQIGKALGF